MLKLQITVSHKNRPYSLHIVTKTTNQKETCGIYKETSNAIIPKIVIYILYLLI
jgi:hypothetical protein